MKVKLLIYSNLKDYVDGYQENEGLVKELFEHKTIKQFLEETIRHERALDAISIVIINDRVVPFTQLNRPLQDGDIVKVYPPMGGG